MNDEPKPATARDLEMFRIALERGLKLARLQRIEDENAAAGFRVHWPGFHIESGCDTVFRPGYLPPEVIVRMGEDGNPQYLMPVNPPALRNPTPMVHGTTD